MVNTARLALRMLSMNNTYTAIRYVLKPAMLAQANAITVQASAFAGTPAKQPVADMRFLSMHPPNGCNMPWSAGAWPADE